MKIKEIFLIVESGNNVIGTWDLLPYLQDEINSQIINEYQKTFQIAAGEGEIPKLRGDSQSAIEFVVPDEGAIARLVFTDNMGVRYEQTDRIHVERANSGGYNGYMVNTISAPNSAYGEYGYVRLLQPK